MVSLYVFHLKSQKLLGILTEDLAVQKNGQRDAM